MKSKISELTKLIQKLPEDRIAETIEYVEKIISENTEKEVPDCPHCETDAMGVVRYGLKDGVQRYKCKGCGSTFVSTTNSAIERSGYGESVWKQTIRDTIDGTSLDDTAENLGFSHATAFNMRHKILSAIEIHETTVPTVLSGVCEIDDTYVLESVKGTKIPDDYHRRPRGHGAKASKRGVSNEQVSIMAGVERNGKIYTKTANRSTPGKDDVTEIFNGHIGNETLILCDGAKSFGVLSDVAEVSNVKNERGTFYNINSVNGYHSFIKTRHNNVYRGVATKYLNRYNALFSLAYNSNEELIDAIYNILISTSGTYRRYNNQLKTANVLDLGQLNGVNQHLY